MLEHVLGEDITLPPDRGVFLHETRRMHPDVCEFISQQIYEGRLTSHSSCAKQSTALGTGLRWLRADHAGCSTESLEEAAIVTTELSRLLGTTWVDQHGHTQPLTTADVLVVAPYNDQVRLLRSHFDSDPLTLRGEGGNRRQISRSGGRRRVLHDDHVERGRYATRSRVPLLA